MLVLLLIYIPKPRKETKLDFEIIAVYVFDSVLFSYANKWTAAAVCDAPSHPATGQTLVSHSLQ